MKILVLPFELPGVSLFADFQLAATVKRRPGRSAFSVRGCEEGVLAAAKRHRGSPAGRRRTSDMNFLQTGLISELRVALNIMTCLSWGVSLKMACTSDRMSAHTIYSAECNA